jgi:hypothetical protein
MLEGMSADESAEEAYRRSEELVFAQLAKEFVFPKEDSVAGLVGRLSAWQSLESKDPSIGDDLLPFYETAAAELKRRVLKACIDNDAAFLRRLSEAAKIIADGKISESLSLDITGYGLKAFRQLRKESGHRLSPDQVRERVDQMRKEEGYPKMSDREWKRTLADLSPLFPQA